MDPAQTARQIALATSTRIFFLYKRNPRSGAKIVITITDVEAIPPMRPSTTPSDSRTRVSRRVWSSGRLSSATGKWEVNAFAVRSRKAAATRMQRMIAKTT